MAGHGHLRSVIEMGYAHHIAHVGKLGWNPGLSSEAS
jgi:hypothetical protein